MKRAYVGAFAFGTAVGICGVAASDAGAASFDRRISAASCYSDGSDELQWSGMSLINVSTDYYLTVQCPIPDDPNLIKQNIDIVNVHVYDADSYLMTSAQTCFSYYHTNDGACAMYEVSGSEFTGPKTLQLQRTYWTQSQANHFMYVQVKLDRLDDGYQHVRGIWVQGSW